jgi:hypothetical protein
MLREIACRRRQRLILGMTPHRMVKPNRGINLCSRLGHPRLLTFLQSSQEPRCDRSSSNMRSLHRCRHHVLHAITLRYTVQPCALSTLICKTMPSAPMTVRARRVQEGVTRLAHAMEDADEGMDAALKRAEEVHGMAAERRDLEIRELRGVIATKEHGIDTLREALSGTKRALEARLRQAGEEATQRDEEVRSKRAGHDGITRHGGTCRRPLNQGAYKDAQCITVQR